MRATATFLVVCGYELRLREQVARSLDPLIASAITPGVDGPDSARAARNAYALCTGLGLLLMAQWERAAAYDLTGEIARIATAISADTIEVDVPTEGAKHLDETALFDTGDSALDDVLQATLDLVGRYGLEHATMQRIARAAGVSEGYVFRRYPTKTDLFLNATDRMATRAAALNNDYMIRLATAYSPGLSAAAMFREVMRPGIELQRGLNLEQLRLTWHNESMRRVVQDAVDASTSPAVELRLGDEPLTQDSVAVAAHVSDAVVTGAILLATRHPDAWQLPYGVITVPLLDSV